MASGCCTPGHNPGDAKRNSATANIHTYSAATVGNGHEESLVTVPAGTFFMGADDEVGFPDDAEGPVREVKLSAFRIDRYTVTNRQYQAFIEATGYRTDAERFGWSYVFRGFVSKATLRRGHAQEVPGLPWWYGVRGAYWARPEGKGSGIADRLDHPVVHVSHTDALAYCAWAGVRLPTEAEWECAARGGLVGKRFVWGDELTPDGTHMCNIWQGTFPTHNTAEDRFEGTAPVDSFKPNGFGLYNIAGNVWEWCADWWTTKHPGERPIIDPVGPQHGTARVMRGGSYLCHHSYCNRYRVAARSSNTPDSSTGNCGFRVAADA